MTTLTETPVSVPAAAANRPSPPRRRTPAGIVDHHMAGYLPGTDRLFQNPATGYSTNYGIGSLDGQNFVIHEYVPDDQVAWGNGNDDLNARAISIEHENNRAQGYASKPTADVHELSARFHAALAIKWQWRIHGQLGLVLADFPNHDYYERPVPDFGVHFNVTGHRTVAWKDCPNELDMRWIVDRANQIIQAGLTAEPKGNRRMYSIVPLVGEGIFAQSNATGKRVHILSPYHVRLLERARDNDGNDNMLGAELDIVAGYVAAIGPDPISAELAKQIIDGLRPEFDRIETGDGATAQEIDQALAGRFATIPAAVADEQAKRLSTKG